MRRWAVLAGVLAAQIALSGQAPQVQPGQADAVVRLLADLEAALLAGQIEQFRSLTADTLPAVDRVRIERVIAAGPASTAAVRERTRRPLDGGFELLTEVLIGRDGVGRIATWRLVVQPDADVPGRFELSGITELASVEGLIRLRLNATKQFALENFRLVAPDLTLDMAAGSAFVAESPGGITALVLRGRGQVVFSPPDPAEQGQLRLFAGEPDYRTDIDAAFIRINPSDISQRIDLATLKPVPVDPSEFRRAQDIFDLMAPRTYSLDLNDLASERWSLEPSANSLVAEIDSRRHGWLTYARSPSEPEDISFFDREDGTNISIYASADKLRQRGPDFSDDADAAYDVERYGLEMTFDPQQSWVSGRASLRLRIKRSGVNTLTLKLEDSLEIASVSSLDYGHLLTLRIAGQNKVIVSLPRPQSRGSTVILDITYAGRLDAQDLDREALAPEGQIGVETIGEKTVFLPETRYLYSNRIFWYPQAEVTDYATASLRVTVPAEYQVVASGSFTGQSLRELPVAEAGLEPQFQRTAQYIADRPARYLSVMVSRFVPIEQLSVPVPGVAPPDASAAGGETVRSAVDVEVVSTPRMIGLNRRMPAKVADVLGFYAATIGEAPYPNFTLAGMDDNLPGGHSPPFFAILHQPLPTTPYIWGSDPVAFDHVYDDFFLAHEVAHQWWGQAVGWKNYHEQWLSEGLAQYFAVLYAESKEGPELAEDLLERMRDSSASMVDEGPISLGYRLGHIKSDGRVFRAVVYNKAAVVMHMLRRLVGDEAFFAGFRDFYLTWRFRKAGTNDLIAAMQPHTSTSLAPFFDQWIRGATLPDLAVSTGIDNDARVATVRVEQRQGVFVLPLRIEVQYRDGTTEDIELPVTVQDETFELPLRSNARRVQVRAETTLGRIDH